MQLSRSAGTAAKEKTIVGRSRPSRLASPWKRFQMVATLPERDQKAVIRLINSLAAVGAGKRNARAG